MDSGAGTRAARESRGVDEVGVVRVKRRNRREFVANVDCFIMYWFRKECV